MFGRVQDEVGSGSVAGLAVVMAIGMLAVAMVPLGGVLAARQELQGAADAAALAAVGLAGLLVVILRGDEVKGMLTELIHRALTAQG